MDWQTVFNLVGGVATAALGWFAKTIYGAIRDLERDFGTHKEMVARDYVTTASLQRLEDKLVTKLDLVLDRLDRKADK